MSDGIEVHFDEKRGCLELACERSAFARFREVAQDQLREFSEIPLEKVNEIHVIDAATFTTRGRTGGLVVGLIAVIVLVLAVIGAYSLILRITS